MNAHIQIACVQCSLPQVEHDSITKFFVEEELISNNFISLLYYQKQFEHSELASIDRVHDF